MSTMKRKHENLACGLIRLRAEGTGATQIFGAINSIFKIIEREMLGRFLI